MDIKDEIIEQVMTFNYFRVEVSTNQDRTKEVRYRHKVRICGSLREIWNNKNIRKTTKAIETQADNTTT